MLKCLVDFKKWVMRQTNNWHEWRVAPRLGFWTRLRISWLKRCGCRKDACELRDNSLIALFAKDLDEDGGYVDDVLSPTAITLHGYLGSGRVTDPTSDFKYTPLNARSLTAFMSPKRAEVVDLNRTQPGSACVVETSGISGGFYQPPDGKSWADQFEPT